MSDVPLQPDTVPGWVDLELLVVERDDDGLVLDSVVSRVRRMRSEPQSEDRLGHPVSLRIRAPAGTGARAALLAVLDAGPEVSILTDDQGSLLLLSVGERITALELHRG